MARSDDWRGAYDDWDGGTYGSAPSSRDWGARREFLQDDELRGAGFQRRGGWREGSDYYGDNPDRHGAGNYDSMGGVPLREQRSYGRDMFQRDWGRAEALDYGGSSNQLFNDRWQEAYGERSGTASRSAAQHRGRGPKNYRRGDERIRDDVCAALTDDRWVDASQVEVSVKDCEVTLSGTVTARDQKRRAEEVVERIRGVRDVHNQIRIAGGSEPAQSESGPRADSQQREAQNTRH